MVLLFKNFGKSARDLFYKDYEFESQFTVWSRSRNGVEINATASKFGHLYGSGVNAEYKLKSMTFNVGVDSNSNLEMITTIEGIAPNMKAILSYEAPSDGMVELQWLKKNVALSTSFLMTGNPRLDFSAVAGNSDISVGTDISYNMKYGKFLNCDLGICYSKEDLTASFTVKEKGDMLTATYYHNVNPRTKTAVGGEIVHVISSAANLMMLGIQHQLDPRTTIKARASTIGHLGGLVQHELGLKALATFCFEVDVVGEEMKPKFGIALAVHL